MKVRRRAELIRVQLADSESYLLAGLIDDFTAMLEQADATDPAMQRLYPDGYSDDDEASAEFRQLVSDDLTAVRTGRLRTCRAELPDGSGTISLDEEAADRWLQVLNDLRLTLGVRLGVSEEVELDSADPVANIYHWLSAVQDLLVSQLMV
ncbi:MAG TPA: DUF2017 family protein [Jatrophihabitans sp.]|nr:DUF2017 family protein [Jatrophihabitans sp.]